MVRFLCFFTPINSHKPKKVAQRSAVTMNLSPQEISQDQVRKASFCSNNDLSSTSVEQVTTPSSHEGFCKSEDMFGNTCPDDTKDFPRMVHLKKSQSLGSILDKRRGFSGDDVTEDDEVDQEFSVDYSHENNIKELDDSFVNNVASAEVDNHRITGENTNNQCHNNEVTEFFDLITDPVQHESIFSIGVLNEFDGKQLDVGENSNEPCLDYTHLSSNNLVSFAKSRSETNLRVDTTNSIEGSPTHELTSLRSRSFEGLCSLSGGRNGSVNGDGTLCSDMTLERHIAAQYDHDTTEASDLDGRGSHCHADLREECLLSNAIGGFDDLADQGSADKYSSRNFEWIKPDTDGVWIKHNLLQDCSIQNWDELTSDEFNTKRIEQWISQIDIQNDTIVEEVGESSYSTPRKERQVVAGLTNPKFGANNLGMEVAYKYISSLTPTSSSAQMSNLGLVAVPFLSAFVGLRVLNLSGNAIVRITAGALPRGLHMLNLSKNNISAIEGLRDLTRLRVLNLSYNRIVRIGHGLGSCCCLKELYLAGNKISEVEGLHRLLKLNMLDLRLNKISTAKGLGQVAANYCTLQAMNLEGNPAQRNVGDEQLKKYLLSLLPHLLYYNKQSIRPKEISDHRPPRSMAAASHPFDRDQRRGNLPSRSSHAVLSKQAKGHRHVRLPPAGSVKPSGSQPGNPMRRSFSEGTL